MEGEVLNLREVGVSWSVAQDAAGVQVVGQRGVGVETVLVEDFLFCFFF